MQVDSAALKAGQNRDGQLNWAQALERAENFVYTGYSDWRLPDAKELQSIVDYTRSPSTTGETMDIFSKKRLTTWTIIIRVITNLTALVLVFITLAKRPLHLPRRFETGDQESVQLFLKDELNLSEEQVLLFQKSAENHHRQSNAIRKDIHRIKREIIEELFVPQPDEEKVSLTAADIGDREALLQNLLFSHFNDVMSMPDQEQKGKFRIVIHGLLETIRPQGPQEMPGNRPPPKKKSLR